MFIRRTAAQRTRDPPTAVHDYSPPSTEPQASYNIVDHRLVYENVRDDPISLPLLQSNVIVNNQTSVLHQIPDETIASAELLGSSPSKDETMPATHSFLQHDHDELSVQSKELSSSLLVEILAEVSPFAADVDMFDHKKEESPLTIPDSSFLTASMLQHDDLFKFTEMDQSLVSNSCIIVPQILDEEVNKKGSTLNGVEIQRSLNQATSWEVCNDAPLAGIKSDLQDNEKKPTTSIKATIVGIVIVLISVLFLYYYLGTMVSYCMTIASNWAQPLDQPEGIVDKSTINLDLELPTVHDLTPVMVNNITHWHISTCSGSVVEDIVVINVDTALSNTTKSTDPTHYVEGTDTETSLDSDNIVMSHDGPVTEKPHWLYTPFLLALLLLGLHRRRTDHSFDNFIAKQDTTTSRFDQLYQLHCSLLKIKCLRRNGRRFRNDDSMGCKPSSIKLDKYQTLSKVDLKYLLCAFGKPSSGDKMLLVTRLVDAYHLEVSHFKKSEIKQLLGLLGLSVSMKVTKANMIRELIEHGF